MVLQSSFLVCSLELGLCRGGRHLEITSVTSFMKDKSHDGAYPQDVVEFTVFDHGFLWSTTTSNYVLYLLVAISAVVFSRFHAKVWKAEAEMLNH
jgi:hypothetical protein